MTSFSSDGDRRAMALLAELAHKADACERSWSIAADAIEARVLFFCDASVETAGLIARTARALGTPDALIAAWSHALPAADAIGLALRCDGRSVRLYTQYWDLLAARVREGRTEPYPLYRGFKALPDGSQRHDDYVCLPMAPRSLFWPAIAEALTAAGLDARAADAAFAALDAGQAIHTVTEGDARKSWLTTVRRAPPDRAAIAQLLAPLAGRPGAAEMIAAATRHEMVHLAGGEDPTKGRFLTVYLESTPAEVLASLKAA
jgi:hypothetical protein